MEDGSDRGQTAAFGLAALLPVVGFVSVAPVGLLMLPLGALSGIQLTRKREAWLVFAISAALAGWWLARAGSPPAQLLRAGALVAAVVYGTLAVRADISATHRGMLAIGTAVLATGGLLLATGRGWSEFQWWAAYDTGTFRMILIGAAMLATRMTGAATGLMGDAQRMADQIPDLAAVFLPAWSILQVFAGLMLAAYVLTRVGFPVGRVGRFKDFTFTVHVGWVAVVAALLVTWGPSGQVWVAAVNTVLVAGALYGVRGAAVVTALWPFDGMRSLALGLVGLVIGLVIWRVALAGLIVVGATDTGLDLRHRWVSQA